MKFNGRHSSPCLTKIKNIVQHFMKSFFEEESGEMILSVYFDGVKYSIQKLKK